MSLFAFVERIHQERLKAETMACGLISVVVGQDGWDVLVKAIKLNPGKGGEHDGGVMTLDGVPVRLNLKMPHGQYWFVIAGEKNAQQRVRVQEDGKAGQEVQRD